MKKNAIETGQSHQIFIGKNNSKIKYLLYLPGDYYLRENKKWPLMIFLHGSMEAGTNLEKVKKHGPPKIVENRNDFPFIVISPQYRLNKNFELSAKFIDRKFIDKMTGLYNVDVHRIYLTGISYGGYLTWKYAIKFNDKFAAIAPVCGFGRLESFGNKPALPMNLGKIKNIPIWVFHGAKDKVVPISSSEIIVDALKKMGCKAKFTRYPDADHDAWTDTYEKNDSLYKWLLKNKKKGQ